MPICQKLFWTPYSVFHLVAFNKAYNDLYKCISDQERFCSIEGKEVLHSMI